MNQIDYAARFAQKCVEHFGHEVSFPLDIHLEDVQEIVAAFEDLGCTVERTEVSTRVVVNCPQAAE